MKDAKLYKIIRPILTLYMKLFYRITIINKDYVPNNEPVILCGNHTNNLDCLLIGSSTKRNVYFLAKKELHKGILKPFFESVGTISVDRSKHNPDALKIAKERLNNKDLICIFPEGTINRTNNIIMPFKFGTVSLVYKTNSYIVPFIITGKYKIFRKSIILKYLSPYKINSSDLVKENNKLMNIIKNELLKETKNNE